MEVRYETCMIILSVFQPFCAKLIPFLDNFYLTGPKLTGFTRFARVQINDELCGPCGVAGGIPRVSVERKVIVTK